MSPTDFVIIDAPADADLDSLRTSLRLTTIAESGLDVPADPTVPASEIVASGEQEWGRWTVARSPDGRCQALTVTEWYVGELVPIGRSAYDCVDNPPLSPLVCHELAPDRTVVALVGVDTVDVGVSELDQPIEASFQTADNGTAAVVVHTSGESDNLSVHTPDANYECRTSSP